MNVSGLGDEMMSCFRFVAKFMHTGLGLEDNSMNSQFA